MSPSRPDSATSTMTRSPFDLTGRTALVTGAARGLGRAIALGLAAHGAAVAVVDRDEPGAAETALAIEALGPDRRAVALACDVGDEADVRRTVAGAAVALVPIDVLVNNAGITARIPLVDWQQADWEALIRVNQIGTFLMAREVGRGMVERRRGSIVNMSALGGGLVGLGRGNAIYCGTKGAVAAMTRDLAAEWARFGVRVNAVAPGWFRTDMNAPLLKNEAMMSAILGRVPLGRLGEPEDVVGPVVFLASDASAMITGHLLPIDGGAATIIRLSDDSVVR